MPIGGTRYGGGRYGAGRAPISIIVPVDDVSEAFKAAASDALRITKKQFIFNGTDYSSRLASIGEIAVRQFEGDAISAGQLSVSVVNDDKVLHAIKTDMPGNFNKEGSVSVGYDEEYVTLYKGKLDTVEYDVSDRARAILKFTAKLKACIENTLGSSAFPLNYSAAAYNPADLAWELLTVRGGLDSTASTDNPDIDYALWLAYKSICSDLGFSLRAYFQGESIAEALRQIGQLTDSLIYPDPSGKVYHRKFIPRESSAPYLFTDASAHLESPIVTLSRDRIINKAKVWYGYTPATITWTGSVTKENATSQTDYGLKGREYNSAAVWHDSLASATAFGERLVGRYYEPAQLVEFETKKGTQAILQQVGDIITVTCDRHNLTAEPLQVYGVSHQAMTQASKITAEAIGVLNSNFFILDSATNGVLDQNVLY